MKPPLFSTRALLVALVALLVGIPAFVGAQLGGGGLSGTSTDASRLTSGTLPDARLSANVPLLDAANTFTASQSVAVSGTGASNVFAGNGWSLLVLSDTAAAANQKRVRFIQDAGVLSVVSEDDAGSGISTLLQATSDGAGAWTEFRVDAAAFDFNGPADFSSDLLVGDQLGIGAAADGGVALNVTMPAVGSTGIEFGALDDDTAFVQVYDRAEVGERGLSILATGLAFRGNGTNVDMTPESGTFSGTWAGCSSGADTVNYAWNRVGQVVTIVPESQQTACASNATTFSAGTVIPAGIRPAVDVWFFTRGADNSAAVFTCVKILTTGVMQANVAIESNCIQGWTASGNKATQLMPMTYTTADPSP